MKKFIIFLLIILIFTIALIGVDQFLKSVASAIAIALILRLVDQVVD